MIVLVSLIDSSIAKKTSCSHCLSHGAAFLHHHSFSRMSRILVVCICSRAHVHTYGAAQGTSYQDPSINGTCPAVLPSRSS